MDQTLGQRMLNLGDLSFETAGGGSRIVIISIDRPQQAADQILALSRAHSAAGTGLDARELPPGIQHVPSSCGESGYGQQVFVDDNFRAIDGSER